jgi:flagellin
MKAVSNVVPSKGGMGRKDPQKILSRQALDAGTDSITFNPKGESPMSLGVLNNISAIYAQNNLANTQAALSKTLQQLSSGSRINSGADDAAGLSLSNALQAASTALSQSAKNASEGVDMLQVADGAMSQITNLLNRAVTLATEASNGTMNQAQIDAANAEYTNILGEIDNINDNTEYNGNALFTGTAYAIYTTDGTLSQSDNATALTAVDSSTLGLTAAGWTDAASAQTELGLITTAIGTIASDRGTVGATINTLTAVSNVMSTESTNTLAAENDVTATDYGQATSDMSKYQILSQTGIAALAQANQSQQLITKLLQ